MVGYYNRKTDKLNDFHLVLVDRSDVGHGSFDISLEYNQLQWETGDASSGVDGLGGTSAAVGFASPGGATEFSGSSPSGPTSRKTMTIHNDEPRDLGAHFGSLAENYDASVEHRLGGRFRSFLMASPGSMARCSTSDAAQVISPTS